MVEISIRDIFKKNDSFKGVDLKIEFSFLQLFETFSESVPQLVLFISLMMQEHELHTLTVLKIAASLMSITNTVVVFYRYIRAFTQEKEKMGWVPLVIYYVWNLLLITARLVAVTLFVSVLPCYFPAHFLCLWVLLFFWAWRQRTNSKDTEGGEWFFRATVGLIWYFSWFRVSSRNNRNKSIIYHMIMVADTALLLGLWFWKRSLDSARLVPLPINPYVLVAGLAALYIIGLLMKLLYYWGFHPNQASLRLEDTLQSGSSKQLSTLGVGLH